MKTLKILFSAFFILAVFSVAAYALEDEQDTIIKNRSAWLSKVMVAIQIAHHEVQKIKDASTASRVIKNAIRYLTSDPTERITDVELESCKLTEDRKGIELVFNGLYSYGYIVMDDGRLQPQSSDVKIRMVCDLKYGLVIERERWIDGNLVLREIIENSDIDKKGNPHRQNMTTYYPDENGNLVLSVYQEITNKEFDSKGNILSQKIATYTNPGKTELLDVREIRNLSFDSQGRVMEQEIKTYADLDETTLLDIKLINYLSPQDIPLVSETIGPEKRARGSDELMYGRKPETKEEKEWVKTVTNEVAESLGVKERDVKFLGISEWATNGGTWGDYAQPGDGRYWDMPRGYQIAFEVDGKLYLCRGFSIGGPVSIKEVPYFSVGWSVFIGSFKLPIIPMTFTYDPNQPVYEIDPDSMNDNKKPVVEPDELDQRKTVEAQIELKGNGRDYVVCGQMAGDKKEEVIPLQQKQ